MKVLHVIPSVAPRYGGPSRAVFEMCRALNERETETLIATTDADGKGCLSVELGAQTHYNNVATIFFARQWSEAFKYSRPLAVWLNAHVRKFDLVHIHAVFSHACLAAARACRSEGVPYIVRPLGSLDPWSLKQKRFRKRLFWNLGVRQMLNGAAAIHYTARAEMEAAEGYLGIKRGVVIPLGIESDLFTSVDNATTDEPNGPIKPPYVLVLSRLHEKKGLEVLLPAFLNVVKHPEFAQWKLVLAGEGEPRYENLLKGLVKSNGGNGNVVFAGWVDGARRKSTLQRASLLALTSYQENFGLSALEALACGVPVLLTSQVNLAQEIDEAGAGWVSPLEKADLEKALAETLRDGAARKQRGARGKELVERLFTWGAIAETLDTLYESVVASDLRKVNHKGA